ncbi:MAG: serine/threonine-protein kinase, partial [Myxococcota bacterium]
MTSEPVAVRASAIQRYRFVRRLATGGMAEVYVAEAIGVAGVTRRVALKRILPNHAKDAAFVTMFLNEARVASTLQHPHIVQTYDVIDDRGEYYIAMELLEGLTLLELRQRLQQRIVDGRPVAPTPGQALYIVDRVLAGLHYAHERTTPDDRPMNIVHRDVSPHNVFLTHDGNVKLLDFGVAKVEALLGREATASGVVKGKVLYMAPEQCQGLDVDRRADLYAVGALLYVLLTGQHPFRGSNPYDTMRAIIYSEPPPPSSFAPAIGPALDPIVARAMAKAPGDRYPSAREMQRAIAAVVRERGWFVTDLDFAAFVESIAPRSAAVDADTRNLPDDLVIGDHPTSLDGAEADRGP